MIKRFIFIGLLLASLYVLFLSIQLNMDNVSFMPAHEPKSKESQVEAPSQKVYSFSFSKYTTDGHKELEIEGDSADIFAKVVAYEYKILILSAQLSELRRGLSDESPELFVEVAQIIKTAIVADVHNVLISIQKQLACVVDLDLIQVLENSQTG